MKKLANEGFFFFALVLCYKFILNIIRGVPNKAVEEKKLAPFCNFRAPFFKKGVQERGSPKRYLNLLVQTVP